MNGAWISQLVSRYPELLPTLPQIHDATMMISRAFERGNKLLIAGNGGSAADASHIAGELLKGFRSRRELTDLQRERLIATNPELGPKMAVGLQRGLPAIALPDQTALVSAWNNDAEPELVYAQLVLALGRPGDVFWGISTSGNAKNVAAGAVAARAMDMESLALTGRSGGRLAGLCDVAVCVPSDITADIQELHLPVYHAICSQVEADLFG